MDSEKDIFSGIGQRYWWVNEESKAVLNRGYLLQGETIESAINRITNSVSEWYNGFKGKNKKYYASVFKEIIEKGWLSMSSPIWSNEGTTRGLSISCFGMSINDSISGISNKLSETIMQTKLGAGTSGYFGNLRGRGAAITNNGVSSGAVSFMELFNTTMNVVSQGSTRRGSFAAYLDIDHPDIEEFLTIKDIGSPIQNLFYGVCVPDYWMKTMINEDGSYDPETVKQYRRLWSKVLESRQFKGLPYIFFTDNVNRNKPVIWKKTDEKITHSNLCSEISIPDSDKESFVCCLSSMNLELFDEWYNLVDKNTGISVVGYAHMFLDGILSGYIKKLKTLISEGETFLIPAYNSTKKNRPTGLGVLGYHSYLQKIGRPFEHPLNIGLNRKIFGYLKQETDNMSIELGKQYGCAPIFDNIEEGSEIIKERNVVKLAIAPTTSSSAILGQVSPGIEPFSSNFYKVNLAKGNFIRKNKYLEKLLNSKLESGIIKTKEELEELWSDIMIKQGSVQHISEDILNKEEKDIFKTFKEISQYEIILQASVRQEYIDQSQSLNLNIPPDTPPKEVNGLIIKAWKLGIKTLYYQRSQSVSKELLSNITNCISCEG
nr:MAG TPA: ribonucleotide-diphosphate reductase subunit alpha [Caudoviricetes sp.]